MWRPQKKDILFVLGIFGIALEEARVFGAPSETLLLVFAAMVGLPLVLRVDETRSTSDTPKSPRSSDGGTSPRGEQ